MNLGLSATISQELLPPLVAGWSKSGVEGMYLCCRVLALVPVFCTCIDVLFHFSATAYVQILVSLSKIAILVVDGGRDLKLQYRTKL
jgi:hypothetical protein